MNGYTGPSIIYAVPVALPATTAAGDPMSKSGIPSPVTSSPPRTVGIEMPLSAATSVTLVDMSMSQIKSGSVPKITYRTLLLETRRSSNPSPSKSPPRETEARRPFETWDIPNILKPVTAVSMLSIRKSVVKMSLVPKMTKTEPAQDSGNDSKTISINPSPFTSPAPLTALPE